jgi:large subunit ribosomal protein L9
MDIILLERVGSLGTIGDVVTVKDGYARNFLLPNKKALRANAANKKVFEANRERIEKENEERRAEASVEGGKLEGVNIELIRQASNTGQLYGSVTVRDIAIALEERGEKVTKKQIILERPIKAIGLHEVRVSLHAEVDASIKVNVARSPEEAELQAQGIDVMAQMFEKEESGFTEDFDPNAEPGEIAAIEEEASEDDTGNAAPAQTDTAEARDAEDGEARAEDAEATAPEAEEAATETDAEPEATDEQDADESKT